MKYLEVASKVQIKAQEGKHTVNTSTTRQRGSGFLNPLLAILAVLFLGGEAFGSCYYSGAVPLFDLSREDSSIGEVMASFLVCHEGRSYSCSRWQNVKGNLETTCGSVKVIDHRSKGHHKKYTINNEKCSELKIEESYYLKRRRFGQLCREKFKSSGQASAYATPEYQAAEIIPSAGFR